MLSGTEEKTYEKIRNYTEMFPTRIFSNIMYIYYKI